MIKNRLDWILLVFLVCALNFESRAQKSINDSLVTFSFVSVNYGYMIPGGDMARRFGNNSEVGLNYTVKLKSKWSISADGQFIFGSKIKENDVLKGLRNSDNQIISADGNYADVRLYERGYYISINCGRVFTLRKKNPNSGLWITAGTGFLQHKIRIETVGNNVPELSKRYVKGYDRLTNGIMFREFIGYLYFGRKKLINFYAGFEFVQAFTQNRRDYNFDTMEHDTRKRTDLLNGLRIGWLLPLYKRSPDKFYFN